MAKLRNPYILPLTPLTALSPIDGRYHEKILELQYFVSEFALIKTRTEVEIIYFISLTKKGLHRKLSKKEELFLLSYIKEFSLEDGIKVKEIEKETRHDVKAVERNLRNIFQKTSLKDSLELIHFGLTSEDINNISFRLMLQRATNQILLPTLKELVDSLTILSGTYKSTPMLARTHGQAAVGTTLGKEIVVFAYRLAKEVNELNNLRLSGKLNGAVGNYNALSFVFPKINWLSFSKQFISSLGLQPNIATTQINPYEDVVRYFQTYQRINNILIDLNQDMWRYISDGWFVQEVKKGEVGSSTMPQKVNPIDFENSEGNLGMANSIIEFFTRKLSVSRLQRDLSDSTVIRNFGTVLGHSLLGYYSTKTGFSRVRPNTQKIAEDLNREWSILSEGVQTFLRTQELDDPYSLLSTLTKGKNIDKDAWQSSIENLPVNDKIKNKLKTLSPGSYIGIAKDVTDETIKEVQKLIWEK